MKKLRICIDTSVVGGCFDEGFRVASLRVFEMARKDQITLLVSRLLIAELEGAPATVRALFDGLPSEALEEVRDSPEAEGLRDAYLRARILTAGSIEDALHVALATVSKADLIVSWNFKHMVHVEKIRAFSAVNIVNGYDPVDIRSPMELFRR